MAALLPPVAEYFRAIYSLGRRALRPALPAIAFVYFYRLGMGLYMDLSPAAPDFESQGMGAIAGLLMLAAGYLPMLVLVYTPFLPFLDEIHRGGRGDFLAAIRRVLDVALQFLASFILQLLIVLGPVLLLVAIGVALSATFSGGWLELLPRKQEIPMALRAAILLVFFVPAFGWLIYSGFHMLFATPALVLEGRGPMAAIGDSWRIVRTHFGGIAGRLLAYVILLFFVSALAALPSGFINMALHVTGNEDPMFKIPAIAWASAVDALLFPFGVAALLLLYRAIVPAAGAAPPADVAPPAGAAAPPPEGEPRPTSPFVFE
jgi:hypothetical protein